MLRYKTERVLLKFGIAEMLIIWGRIGGQSEAFTGPSPEIHIFAAGAAKWPECIAGRVNTRATTRRAGDDFEWNSALIRHRSGTQ